MPIPDAGTTPYIGGDPLARCGCSRTRPAIASSASQVSHAAAAPDFRRSEDPRRGRQPRCRRESRAVTDSLGADVQVALDGKAAIEAARLNRPALVVLDLGMPEMDGYAVAAALRIEMFESSRSPDGDLAHAHASICGMIGRSQLLRKVPTPLGKQACALYARLVTDDLPVREGLNKSTDRVVAR